LPQQLVAGHVAAGIVDDLELIEIEIAQHVFATPLLRELDDFLQAILELAAIHEAGEVVVRGLIAQLIRQLVCFGDVHQRIALHALAFEHEVAGAQRHPHRRIVVLQQEFLVLQFSAGVEFHQQVGGRSSCLQHFQKRVIQHRRYRQPQHARGLVVRILDATAVVFAQQQRNRRRVGNQAEAELAFA
jgi:hypothetical protein